MEPSIVSSISETDPKHRLLEACNVGDLKYLGEFIVSGGNLSEIVDENSQTSLHYCVKRTDQSHEQDPIGLSPFDTYDRLKCARVIIKANPEFMTTADVDGMTPLHLAVLHGDLDFVKLLHEFNCDFKTPIRNNFVSESVKMSGRNCIHLAVINDQIQILTYLLTINAKEYINNMDDQGATALHYAVQLEPEKAEKVIEMLVEQGHANIDPVDGHGRTPLIWASTVGSNSAVRILLKKGANLSMKDNYGLTALHCAASRGQLEIIQAIMLWLSVANADDLDKMAGFRDIPDADGCSPLFYSVTMGHPKVTSCLLKYGSNVMLVDSKGRTLCHCLARINIENQERKAKVISIQLKELLKHGMNPWQLNMNGATALHEACLLRNVVLVEELIKLDRFKEFVNLPESLGHTPLHLVVAASWSTDPTGLKLCRCLLQNGADVNAITKLPGGRHVTSLDLAKMNEVKVKNGEGGLQKLLRSNGAKTYEELMAEMKIEQVSESTEHSQLVLDPSASYTPEDTIPEDLNIPLSSATADRVDGNTNLEVTGDTGIQVKPKYTDAGFMVAEPIKQNKKPEKIFADKSSQNRVMNQPNYCQTDRNRHCAEKAIQIGQISMQNNQTNTSSVGSSLDSSPSNGITNSDGDKFSQTAQRKPSKMPSAKNQQTKKPKPTGQDPSTSAKPPISYKAQLPFSQTYLERELPKLLKQYLDKENQSYSILTGRRRMPKPTVSPYLMPVVPGLQSSDYLNLLRGQRSAMTRRPLKPHGQRKESKQRSDNESSTSSMPPLKRGNAPSHQQNVSRQRSGNSQSFDRSTSNQRANTAARVRQSVTDYEFYRFIDQLLKHDHMHKYNGPPSRVPNKSPPKQKAKPSKHRTAMGGEISPPGGSDKDSDSDESNRPKAVQSRPKSSKPKYYHKNV